MSTCHTPWRTGIDVPRAFGRRALLKLSAVGGATLGVTLLSKAVGSAQRGQQPSMLELMKTLPIAHRRRVVTGHNADGKSYIVSDEVIPDNSGGILGSTLERLSDGEPVPGHMDLWATSAAQPLGPGPFDEPHTILPSTSPHVDPAKGGTRWYVATLPPGFNGAATIANRQGMHRTLTIDLVFVLSGEITMLMDVPPEVKLKTGDVVVQRNTFHAWRVDGSVPVSLLATLVRVDS
jgi:naringenin degradation protein FdeH